MGPDFLIIGAMKGGTTTLAAQLAAQPGIFMTTPKEPNFFSNDEIFAHGQAWYEALFETADPSDLKGEASTHYTKLPTYPETVSRLATTLGAPRLIYMIRNPVDRAVSHYIHEWTTGEIRSGIDAALDRHPELIAYGCYGMQLAPFVETFGLDQICLTSLETLTADPQAELTRIGAFLDAAQPLAWDEGLKAQNVSAERFRRLPFQRLLIDNSLARLLRRRLVPKSVRDRLRRTRSITRRPDLSPAVRQRIEAVFAKDREALAGWFPRHPALTAAYPFIAA